MALQRDPRELERVRKERAQRKKRQTDSKKNRFTDRDHSNVKPTHMGGIERKLTDDELEQRRHEREKRKKSRR